MSVATLSSVRSGRAQSLVNKEWVWLAGIVILMSVGLTILEPNFLTQFNFYVLLRGIAVTLIVAYAQLMVLVVGQLNLSAGATATVNVPLIEPGTLYGPRQRQLDVRLSKRLRFGRARVTGNLDIANVLNASAATSYNNTYGPNWQNPTAIQLGRFFKFGAQLDF